MTASNSVQPPKVVPRILVVSRRSIRKNKFIDFVGEYHLDLLVRYGACPVIVPRVENVSKILDSFEPFHGVLLAEGEDISPAFRGFDPPVEEEVLSAIKDAHPGDAVPDFEKDRIEFELVSRCLRRGIPYMGICRGSQLLNLVAGGTLLLDIETEVEAPCKHIDYNNYDDHRHPVSIDNGTPLSHWFDGAKELSVNSYHHQGIQKLAPRFVPMAHSPDGLVEAFYDPEMYCPEQGRFFVGLQFHPERMQNTERALRGEKHSYDYPGCPRPYEAFVRAATAFRIQQEPGTNRGPLQPVQPSTMGRRGTIAHLSPESQPFKEKPFVSGTTLPGNDQIEEDVLFETTRGSYRVKRRDESKRSQNMFRNMLTRRGFLEADTAPYKYSKEDERRLYRYGASVHGSRVAFKLLNNNPLHNNDENLPPVDSMSRSTSDDTSDDAASDWDSFRKELEQAESHLKRLRGSSKMQDAVALIRKLSQSLSF